MWVIKITFQLRQENVNKKKVKEKISTLKEFVKDKFSSILNQLLGPFPDWRTKCVMT